ncbi:MAG: hypothetical protein LUI12_02000 [Clostridiales bacterium]|nr:hypothetical protein [Clostridiales bacterium]
MKELLKNGGAYGAQVGHRTVFTEQGAIDRYKMFLDVCYHNLTPESSKALTEVEQDLVKIGFTWEELGKIENEYIENNF